MTCGKFHDSQFLSLFIIRVIGWFTVTILVVTLSVTHKNQPRSRSVCLYLTMFWVLASYSLYISYRVYECLKADFSDGYFFLLLDSESYSLDVDWPGPRVPEELYYTFHIFYVVWRAFQYANPYMVFGAAFYQIQLLATLYTPPLGASSPFKRMTDLAVVMVGLIAMTLEWVFFGLAGKFSTRGEQIGGFNYAWHVISFLNLLGSALSIRGSKGQNKVC
jgi:hypothetical protein